MNSFFTALFKTENLAILICIAVIGMLYKLLLEERTTNQKLGESLSHCTSISEKVLLLIQIVHDGITRGPR